MAESESPRCTVYSVPVTAVAVGSGELDGDPVGWEVGEALGLPDGDGSGDGVNVPPGIDGVSVGGVATADEQAVSTRSSARQMADGRIV